MQKNSSASPLAPLRAAIHPQASKPWGFLADFDKRGWYPNGISLFYLFS
jgi:hypothetical protein